jgi:hypothetical protein
MKLSVECVVRLNNDAVTLNCATAWCALMMTLTKTVTGRVVCKYLEQRHDLIRLNSQVIHEI